MLKQAIEQHSEARSYGPVPASNTAVSDGCGWEKGEILSELNRLEAALAASEAKYQVLLDTQTQAFDHQDSKELSDIATRLTSANGVESRISDFVSLLARIFGGGLRTSW